MKCRVNSQKTIKLCLSVPDDNDCNANPNYTYILVISDNYKLFREYAEKAIAINRYVKCNYSQRIIVDVLSFIKKSNY